jgi:hypothetical protein
VVTVFAIPGYERLPLPSPAPDESPLSRREAILLARRELRALVEPVRSAATDRHTPAAAPPDGNRLIRSGELWEVSWGGRTVTLRHAKGLADLARVLQAGGTEIHCLDLASAGVEEPSTGGAIDATARREYERRIVELQGDIEEAEAGNDIGRAERAQAELDLLLEHLAAALGLGGRARLGVGTAERARSAVTHRLRSTIRRIGREHPDLGRHLEASVRTGVYCSYRPERPTSWVTSGEPTPTAPGPA